MTKMVWGIGVVVGLLPLFGRAATTSVGDYAALTNTIANCADGDTINFTNNITVSAEIAISTKGLTLNGNNYSICAPGNSFVAGPVLPAVFGNHLYLPVKIKRLNK